MTRRTIAALLVSAALALPGTARAQRLGLWDERPGPLVQTIREGIDAYYGFDYDRALAAFDRVAAARPEHPAGPFLKAEAYWWLFLNDRQNGTARRNLEASLERAIRLAEARLEVDPDDVETLFILGSAYGRRGMLAGTRKDAWDAARDAKRAKAALDRVQELDPDNADAAAAEGLYEYYVGTFGAVTRAASRILFGLKGDKRGGLEALDRARREGTYARTEAAFFQGLFYLQYESRPDLARPILDRLRARYPANLYFTTMAAYARQRQGRLREAEGLYRETLRRLAATRVYGREGESLTRFFYGQTLMGLGENDAAWEQFVRVVQLGAKESDSYPHAYLWLGRLADLRGEREIALRYYRRVLALPDAAGSHDDADRLVDDAFTPRQLPSLVAEAAR